MNDRLEPNTTFCQSWNTGAGDLLWEDHALKCDLNTVLKHKQIFKEPLWRRWGDHLQHNQSQRRIIPGPDKWAQLCRKRGTHVWRISPSTPCCELRAYRNTILYEMYSFFLKCLHDLKLTASGMQKSKRKMEISVVVHIRNHLFVIVPSFRDCVNLALWDYVGPNSL